nr:ABC transporter ATP-binding protein [Chloroflexota bacterium]
MPPLLSVRNLGLTYPNADGGLSALRDLTFDIAPGEFVAVVGP